jgi:hypothetical protein
MGSLQAVPDCTLDHMEDALRDFGTTPVLRLRLGMSSATRKMRWRAKEEHSTVLKKLVQAPTDELATTKAVVKDMHAYDFLL